ncbi:hypothetical protein Aph01nite_65180 [Acrocarpospora phusangensis]|uniref:Uncharacterized protein n=1 Tax=Acrocarpospora phusangensis TaxID=1070424 RepID=A0A919QG70_9ACTN|nr:hypothetical protein [Acrocarpospora phusangensis]GIH28208.1 hypothetical protein Aph01nite_65180 [Acrocarpospora phusangensis]
MGADEEVSLWSKIVYLVKGVFLLGVFGAEGAAPPALVETIENDGAHAAGGGNRDGDDRDGDDRDGDDGQGEVVEPVK